MIHRKILVLPFILIYALFLANPNVASMPVEAQTAYQIPAHSPRPPTTVLPTSQPPVGTATALDLPPLKAVLLVGPIDGDDGDWTLSEVANMELAADVLEANGVSVHRFYAGDGSTFADIEAAAEGAHFLLYRGHGVYDGNLPYPEVGGFYLSSGFYLSDRIRSNLHLAPNAIVMLYGCFTAGSSSAEGDEYDIGIEEASRRVAQYSDPFFDIGAAGYYANWFGNAFAVFLTNLFAGQTLGQAYENYFDFNANTVYRTTHPDHPTLVMWLDKDNWDYWKYNNAFAGQSDQTLSDLFQPAALGGLPSEIRFVYSLLEQKFLNETFLLAPKNTGNSEPLVVTFTTSSAWLTITPPTGTTPQTFSVTTHDVDLQETGVHTGSITTTATTLDLLPVANSPQTIPVSLSVIDTPYYRLHLPVILR